MNLQIRTKLLIFSYAVQIEISRFVKKFSDVPQSLAHKGFQTKQAGDSGKKSFFGRKLMHSNGLSPNEIHYITTKFYPYTAAESLKSTGDSAVGKKLKKSRMYWKSVSKSKVRKSKLHN
jgi:hypothetical protein